MDGLQAAKSVHRINAGLLRVFAPSNSAALLAIHLKGVA
jgi:hypothetical protein